jgi:chaperone modulatory protein CbpM
MHAREIVTQVRIEATVLNHWVEAGWLVPRRGTSDQEFSEVDLARAHLIRDLQSLGANDESIPVILDLVDQLHGVRRLLQEVLSTIKDRPTPEL